MISNVIAAQLGTPVPPAKATGGTITFSGGYYYHTFTSNGTFTPTADITCDVLRIAGGGGASSGGSGAGGLLYSSATRHLSKSILLTAITNQAY